MNQLFWAIDTFTYFLCIWSIIYKIYRCEIKRKSCIVINIGLIITLLLSAFITQETEFLIIWGLIQVIQIILIRLSVCRVNIFVIIAIYSLLYSINSILSIGINSFAPFAMTTIVVIEFITHILSSACFIFCCYNEKTQNKVRQILSVLPTKIKVLILFSFFISATLMVVMISSSEMYEISLWSITVRTSLVFFVLFVCTVFPILLITILTNTYLKKENESFERELESQAKHYVALAESNKELSRFKHDFKNLRIGITKALESGDNTSALEIIENGQHSFVEATENIIKFNTGNGIVDAILGEKQKAAAQYNATIIFDGKIPQTAFSPTDLCILFGNTLDNAVEACAKIANDNEKVISVSVSGANGFVFISISNPVAEKVVVRNNIVETTKNDRKNHGFGLYSLGKIAKKYNGEMNILSDENKFTVNIDLYSAE